MSRVEYSVAVTATLDDVPHGHAKGHLINDRGGDITAELCKLADQFFEACGGIVDGKPGDKWDVILTIKPLEANP